MDLQIARDDFDRLVSLVEDYVNDEVDVREDYSGRGMFGKECVGIVMPERGVLFLGMALQEVLGDEAFAVAKVMQTDSMGRDAIFYFPGITVEAE